MPLNRYIAAVLFSAALVASPQAFAAQSFKDVPPSHGAYKAVEYLRAANIVGGYSDGTFQPDKVVNRAEALKLILAPVLPADGLEMYKHSAFNDVPDGSWYLPYVEAGRTVLGIVAGPPERASFNPSNPIKKAEFLKMFLLTQRINPAQSYGELGAALASDTNSSAWHFPFMRYALASSMIIVSQDGYLQPEKNLTRGEIANMMYFFAMHQQGLRTQTWLDAAETEMVNVVNMMEQGSAEQAEFAAARATVMTRGVLSAAPDAAVVKGAVKIAEGFKSISRAYRAGQEGRLDDAIRLAGEGWSSGARAKELSNDPKLVEAANQVQELAKQLADSARAANQ